MIKDNFEPYRYDAPKKAPNNNFRDRNNQAK
jgi:hypothetical protein